ncbi:GNAT family N-acetyltransferase [Zhihengliuella sp.]|uniref:GNAT family N-acetyltransferase n=1 Tax=Zhihengliuella sp. TaxID=1954483 RepID=UPI002810C3BD|nr:GNAT family N-acetyltransferase [Zhihengliuella sp.]
MRIDLRTPTAPELPAIVDALRSWQQDGLPIQLHPGDLGWSWQIGAEGLAARLRIWAGRREVLAVGMLDGPDVLRLGIAPHAAADAALAQAIAADLSDPSREVLPDGPVSVEARFGPALRKQFAARGWQPGEVWAPFVLDLDARLPDVEVPVVSLDVGRDGFTAPDSPAAELVAAWSRVHAAAFDSTRFTVDRWQMTANGYPYASARCLLALDPERGPVATSIVWSAGPGRPGLIEPLGVEPDARGSGFGRAITLASAHALRALGSSSVLVCTPAANTPATATYAAAGFQRLPDAADFTLDRL